MLNKQTLLLGAMLFGSLASVAQQRSCAAMPVLEHQKHNDAFLEQRMEAIEQHTQNFAANGIQSRAAVTIPVVVHVLYNNTTTNISDAQILSQIAILNADFAASNADYSLVPSTFTGVRSGNTGIQFCMAKRDPVGNATTGIVRKATTKTSFEANTDDAKNATTGAVAWASGQYLNIWVVPAITSGGQSGILGYAQFPGGTAATDGLVIGYNYFGNTGAVAAPYNKGRTATHEIGHWLNLRHIWGDATCGSDLVNDTPLHNTANYGCPAAGHKSTCTGTPIEMTMNYMDYTDDACMYMFSAGQKTRMDALFATGGSRASLLTSQGCTSPTGGTTCAVPTALSTSSITATSATLSWGAASGASSYTLQYKTAAATAFTTVTGIATPTWTLTGLTAATTYNFQVATVCGTTITAYTASSFTTLAAGAVTYCTSKGTSAADEFINNVKLAKTATPAAYVINNTSGNNAGYANFTTTAIGVQRGTGYTISIVPGWTSSVYGEGYRVWVDWNRDGDFLDTGENVYSKSTSTAALATGAFTIPATAALGATRMRVQMKYNSGTITSCETFSYGEVEDYALNVAVSARESAPTTAAADAIVPMDLVVFPNPASAELNLVINEFDGIALNAMLTSVTGAVIENFKITASTSIISLANLPAGMYFVTIYGADKQVITRKFIKE